MTKAWRNAVLLDSRGDVILEALDNVSVIQGKQGEPGAKGADGQPGAKGADGQPGAKGADGKDGKSAYQIAVDNGEPSTGTEQEWLKSLKGTGGTGGTGGTRSPDKSEETTEYFYHGYQIKGDYLVIRQTTATAKQGKHKGTGSLDSVWPTRNTLNYT